MIASLVTALIFSAAQPTPAAALLDLQHQWAEARKHADMPFLERFYAREFTVGTIDGREATRAEDLALFSSGDLKPAVIEDSGMKVDLLGEAALVTGIEHLEGAYKGRPGKFDLRFANTYIFRDNRWQLVRHQATSIHTR